MSSLEIRAHAFRLHPNDDLYEGIREYVMKNEIQAGTIQTCVGSLNQIAIRLADETKFANRIENFEICSLVGTVSQSGLHLHISLSDHEGKMLGGHVMPGCKIYTTGEIVLLEFGTMTFNREMDSRTGFKELVVRTRSPSSLTEQE